MTYTDLGQYTFITGADYTGFNPGNLTSILNLSTIRVPQFELYRMVIDTSAVPSVGTTPSLVQQSQMAVGTSLTALNITMPAKTTEGNLVVVALDTAGSTANPVPSAMTLGGSADHFGSAVQAGSASDTTVSAIWADPSCGQASTAIAVTMGSGSGSAFVTGVGYEIAGCLATSSAAACVDKWAYEVIDSGAGSTTVATPAVTTTQPSDFVVTTAMSGTHTAAALTGAGANATASTARQLGTGYQASIAAWSLASSSGTSVVGGAATTPATAAYWTAVAATFLPSASAGQATPFPFTVNVDGRQWDKEQTVAGVGYTYAIGQSPLVLRTGENLQILWDLPAALYANYAASFNITAWFRYQTN